MPVDDAPDDDDVRQTYNFAPGNYGIVYRADVPDYGAGRGPHETESAPTEEANEQEPQLSQHTTNDQAGTRYKLQPMKWGLVPFWTKRNPDYGSVMKTINARDDALATKGGMWQTMKRKKRCIVIAQGFYEWLKKNGGKEKIPHFAKRKDQQLMCFAGLWDCVRYEGSDEKHYTYTIITTDSNKQLSFLHDRMPVILENGSHDIRTWLDPARSEWSRDLQSLLKPFTGELECYPVSKDVGKVGNNSPSFIIPVASSENKHNIANFFSNAKTPANEDEKKAKAEPQAKQEDEDVNVKEEKARLKAEQHETEDNAPLPRPEQAGTKRSADTHSGSPPAKAIKTEVFTSPKRPDEPSPSKKIRSATSNGTAKGKGSPIKPSVSQKISDFFKP